MPSRERSEARCFCVLYSTNFGECILPITARCKPEHKITINIITCESGRTTCTFLPRYVASLCAPPFPALSFSFLSLPFFLVLLHVCYNAYVTSQKRSSSFLKSDKNFRQRAKRRKGEHLVSERDLRETRIFSPTDSDRS